MKKKYLTLCLFSLLLVGCQGSKPSTTTNSDNTSYNNVVTDADYDHVFGAVNLKDNDTFTGYRLTVTLNSPSENVYSMQKFVYIDREQGYYHIEQNETKIVQNSENVREKETKITDVYYDHGSSYVLQEDNSFKQIDGTVSQSSLKFNLNPKKEYFSEFNLIKQVNVYSFEGTINPASANSLFNTTGLENINNATMTINVHDNILDDLSYNYTLDNITTSISILMFYSPYTIILPTTR